jgi:hypothetical protein
MRSPIFPGDPIHVAFLCVNTCLSHQESAINRDLQTQLPAQLDYLTQKEVIPQQNKQEARERAIKIMARSLIILGYDFIDAPTILPS